MSAGVAVRPEPAEGPSPPVADGSTGRMTGGDPSFLDRGDHRCLRRVRRHRGQRHRPDGEHRRTHELSDPSGQPTAGPAIDGATHGPRQHLQLGQQEGQEHERHVATETGGDDSQHEGRHLRGGVPTHGRGRRASPVAPARRPRRRRRTGRQRCGARGSCFAHLRGRAVAPTDQELVVTFGRAFLEIDGTRVVADGLGGDRCVGVPGGEAPDRAGASLEEGDRGPAVAVPVAEGDRVTGPADPVAATVDLDPAGAQPHDLRAPVAVEVGRRLRCERRRRGGRHRDLGGAPGRAHDGRGP